MIYNMVISSERQVGFVLAFREELVGEKLRQNQRMKPLLRCLLLKDKTE